LLRPPCDDHYRQTVTNFRQIRKALGENAERMERLLILLLGERPGTRASCEAEYAGTRVAFASIALLAALSRSPETAENLVNGVFTIDPRGSLMIQYAADALPKTSSRIWKNL